MIVPVARRLTKPADKVAEQFCTYLMEVYRYASEAQEWLR